MTVEEFAKQFRWGTDQKTIKALEKMRAKELKERKKNENNNQFTNKMA